MTGMQMPSIPRYGTDRDPAYDAAQLMATQNMGLGGDLLRPGVELPQPVASSDDDTGGEEGRDEDNPLNPGGEIRFREGLPQFCHPVIYHNYVLCVVHCVTRCVLVDT